MAKQDRLSIDLQGLRQQIEGYRDDPAWQQLSMGAKIRAMLQELLALRGKTVGSIAQIVSDNWDAVLYAGLDITGRRLQEIRDGARPTDEELIDLATVLPQDSHQLIEIRDRTFSKPNGKPNGHPSRKV